MNLLFYSNNSIHLLIDNKTNDMALQISLKIHLLGILSLISRRMNSRTFSDMEQIAILFANK